MYAYASMSDGFRLNPTKGIIDIEELYSCTFCGECEKKAEALGQPGAISIKPRDDKFLFSFEVCHFVVLSLTMPDYWCFGTDRCCPIGDQSPQDQTY